MARDAALLESLADAFDLACRGAQAPKASKLEAILLKQIGDIETPDRRSGRAGAQQPLNCANA